MVKVKLGDSVETMDFGSGRVVAMTEQWCVYVDASGSEYAVTWEDVFLPAVSVEPGEVCSAIGEYEKR